MVKRIKGTDKNWLERISFAKADGTEIKKVEIKASYPYGPEVELSADEEIIGVFGNKDSSNIIFNMGFIVWKPPKY